MVDGDEKYSHRRWQYIQHTSFSCPIRISRPLVSNAMAIACPGNLDSASLMFDRVSTIFLFPCL